MKMSHLLKSVAVVAVLTVFAAPQSAHAVAVGEQDPTHKVKKINKDRVEDVKDRKEDARDRLENKRDRAEDRRDDRIDGGKKDKLEDVRDQREDLKDRAEDRRDRREDKREDRRDGRDNPDPRPIPGTGHPPIVIDDPVLETK